MKENRNVVIILLPFREDVRKSLEPIALVQSVDEARSQDSALLVVDFTGDDRERLERLVQGALHPGNAIVGLLPKEGFRPSLFLDAEVYDISELAGVVRELYALILHEAEVQARAATYHKMREAVQDPKIFAIVNDLVLEQIKLHRRLETLLNQRSQELEKALRKIEETQAYLLQAAKMAAVGQLAGGIAHEMNNPLTVILGFAECLAKRLSCGDPLEMPIKSIQREAIRCGKLVQDLLVFSRSQKTEAEELDVVKTIEGAMSLISARAKNGNIKLVREFEKNIPHIFANLNQLQQAIINLSNNAFDAMGEKGTLTIRARSLKETGKRCAEIQVEDTGTGIPEEIRSRIFEPFFTTKEAGKGTGLGLGLCYEIVKNVGGAITFTTEMGKGTCFTLRLPAVDEGDNAK